MAAGSGDGSGDQPAREKRRYGAWVWVWLRPAIVLVALASALLVLMTQVDMDLALSRFNDWIQENMLVGAFAYGAAYVASFMAMVPSTPMELLGGYVFGFFVASLILTLAKPLAYVCTFQAGRLAGLGACGASLQRHAKLLDALGRVVENDPRARCQIVFFVCLSFLPAGVKTCGMAAIPAVTPSLLLGCSLLASLPYTAANAWLGSSARDLRDILGGPHEDQSPEQRYTKIAVMALGTVGLLCTVAALGCYGKRALSLYCRVTPRLPPTAVVVFGPELAREG